MGTQRPGVWCAAVLVCGVDLLLSVSSSAAELAPRPGPSLSTACRANALPALGPRTAGPRLVAQVTRNDRADLTFDVQPASDGSVVVQAAGGELVIRKTVTQGGGWTLDLQARNDKVRVAMVEQAITVVRGRRSISVPLGGAAEEQMADVRRLVADSRAVLLFRAASAAIEESGDEGAPAASILMADAIVGALGGDVGAPRRIARHLARRALARARVVSMAGNCYAIWEQQVMHAWNDYSSCITEVSPWAMLQILCAARWSLMVESYWWTFIACSSLPF